MRARHLAITAGLALAVTAGLTGPAGAAAGVDGRIDAVSVRESTSCTSSCSYNDVVHVKGWALNKSTIPVQDVRFVVSGTAYYVYAPSVTTHETRTSKALVSNRCRKDVAAAKHVKSCALGYDATFTTGTAFLRGRVTVCAQARDHGTSQAWRKIGSCKVVTASRG